MKARRRLTDFFLILAETLIAASLTTRSARWSATRRQGWAILAAMLIVLVLFVLGAYWAESAGNPRLTALGVEQTASNAQPGGNMEGKEVRFGIARSALFATATTATSNGAVNSMHDSFTPLGGLVPLFMMQFGEVILGGVGSGLYGMMVFAIIAVFIAGLMVGRTPEYLGKKIEPYEMKMASLLILIMPIVVLGFTAVAVVTDVRHVARILNPGAHGFSEICMPILRMGNNNGSAFGGLECQYTLLQCDRRTGDADLPLLAGDSDAGVGRIAGDEEDRAGRAWAPCRPIRRCLSCS